MNRRQALLCGLGLTTVAPRPANAQLSTRLNQRTEVAYDAYIAAAENKLEWRSHLQPSGDGQVAVASGGDKSPKDVPGGLIHDWMAAALAPRVSIEKLLAVFQDYPAYKFNFAPNISDSRVLSRDGDRWRVWLKLYKKQVFTSIWDTEYDIQYKRLDGGKWAVTSRSTKVAEVEDGRELPVGTGRGFLWRLNSYWLLEPRTEGVYMECRAISLSRDVPIGLAWAVKPMLVSVPRESLIETVTSTIKAVR